MLFKASKKNLIYFSILTSIILLLHIFESEYQKSISLDLIKILQKDKYIVSSMQYVSSIGSDNFRLLSLALVIVIGTKFQLYLLTLLYSFCSLFVNLLKINLREARPYWETNNIHGYACAYDFGFPADHLITTVPFTFFLWEIIFERLNFNALVNAKYFKLIGNAICVLISLSIGFSRFVLGLNYLHQFAQGLLIGFAIWFAFKNFLEFRELKFYLETRVLFSKRSKMLFAFVYNLTFGLFLFNFLLVLKTQDVELNEISRMRNLLVCGKPIHPLQPLFASLLDSAKFYCFFALISSEIYLTQKCETEKISKLKEAFKINETNKTVFYDLCIAFYANNVKGLSSSKEVNVCRSDKSLMSFRNLNEINSNDNVGKSNKAEFEFAKFLFVFVIFFVFAFVRQALYLLNSFVFYDNIITKFYLYEMSSYAIIGFFALLINKKIDKYF